MPPTQLADMPAIHRAIVPFQQARLWKSLFQIANTFVPFFAICAVLYAVPELPLLASLALSVVAGGLSIRIFIIQHDCGHGSFFASKAANNFVGRLCSIVTFAPYDQWRRHHNQHHGNWNNLDRRESGADIYSTCLTVEEYRAMSKGEQFRYRLLRHPAISLVLLPPVVFLLLYRKPFDSPAGWLRERAGVHLTNLALVVVYGTLMWFFGVGRVLTIHLPIILTAAIVGVWLFSIQHRFEETFWGRREAWTAAAASLQGSSYLRLPRVLQWFTGNIGFHHVHHLSPRVPNYRLQTCHHSVPALQEVPTLTLKTGLTSWRYALWDEKAGRMVPFDQA